MNAVSPRAVCLALTVGAGLMGPSRTGAGLSHTRFDTVGWSLERVGQLGGPSLALAAKEPYVYLGLGPRLEVLDVSGIGDPLRVGSFKVSDTVLDLELAADTAYLLESGNRLHVLDLADPANPTEVAVLDAPALNTTGFEHLSLHDRFLYATGPTGIAPIDVSDPMQPRWVGLTRSVSVSAATVSGDLLYLASGGDLVIAGLSDPTAPSEIGRLHIVDGGIIAGLAVDDGRAVVSVWSPEFRSQSSLSARPPLPTIAFVVAVDVTDPAAPRETDRFETGSETLGPIAIDGTRAFVLGTFYIPGARYGGGELIGIDLSDLGQLQPLGHASARMDIGSRVVVANSHAYVSEASGGLHVFDVSAPGEPRLSGRYNAPSGGRAIAAAGGRVALAEEFGVWSVDASDPADPRIDRPFAAREICWGDCDMALAAGVALLADQNFGFFAFDARDSTAPAKVARLAEVEHAIALDVGDSLAVVLGLPGGFGSLTRLSVVDVSEPAAPGLLAQRDMSVGPTDVAIADHTAFVTHSGGLIAFDLGDPSNPLPVGALNVGDGRSRVAAAGRYVFVVEENGTIHAIDASQPTALSEIGLLDKARDDALRPNQVVSVVAEAGVLYVAHSNWVQAVDIRIPQSPKELTWAFGTNFGASNIRDMDVEDGFIHLATETDGYVVAQLNRPQGESTVLLPVIAAP